jgi:hypothetical protein
MKPRELIGVTMRILLTSSVGGNDSNWRNKLLGKLILNFQKIKEADSKAKFSHAELLLDDGSTFGARWRTRERDAEKGLNAYKGANVLIASIKNEDKNLSNRAYLEVKEAFDGDLYPVLRLLLQGVSAFALPWIVKVGFGSRGVCSEVVACFLMEYGLISFWKGVTPAMIDNWIRDRNNVFNIDFEGVL